MKTAPNPTPNSVKESLSIAKQVRCCPPPGLKSNGYEKFLKKHMGLCPYCGTDLSIYDNNDAPWEKLADRLQRALKKSKSEGPIKKGELRRIASRLAGWRDGFYYNPPLVIVYEVDADFPEIVQVVQVYDDILLAGPGDLILTEDMTNGTGSLLVECWNSYTIKASFLDPTISVLSEEIMDAVCEMVTNEAYTPSWALLPPPMTEHDPRRYFRKLEVDVAYTFGSYAASELI